VLRRHRQRRAVDDLADAGQQLVTASDSAPPRTVTEIGYAGPLSVEWEDAPGMDGSRRPLEDHG